MFLQSWLASPLRAALTLAVLNVLIFGATMGLFLVAPILVTAAAVMGPVLSFAAWSTFGMAVPHKGSRRLLIACGGMAVYLLLIPGALLWLRHIEATTPPDADTFHAWLGSILLMAVGLGAALLGSLTVGLSRRP